MNAQVFRQTEGLLYRYWKKKLRIERLQSIIQQINDQVAEIKTELAEATPVPRVVAMYRSDGGPAAPVGGTKGLDNALENYDEMLFSLQVRYVRLRRRIWSLKVRVWGLEEENAGVEAAVNQLTTDEKRIVEYRYLYKHSNYAIGQIMALSESTVRRKRRGLVIKVADYMGRRNGGNGKTHAG